MAEIKDLLKVNNIVKQKKLIRIVLMRHIDKFAQ